MGKCSSHKILLIDDDRNDVTLMTKALRDTNPRNEIIVAENGEEALDFLYKRRAYEGDTSGLPVFILLDIKLPLMSGIQVLKFIRSNRLFNRIPVIMITSSQDNRDLKECYELGANSFVVKPVNINDFSNVVKNICHFWIGVNEISS